MKTDNRSETITECSGWLALYTKANQEHIAVDNIVRQGYSAYCPFVERRRKHARKVDKVRRPLFPGYAFARLTSQQPQWRPLLSTKGVSGVVRFGDRLGFVPVGLLEQLQSCEQRGGLARVAAPAFPSGTQVRIIDGPFNNLIGRILSLPEKDRVWVLIDIMGREVRTQYDVWSLTRKSTCIQ